MPPINQSAGCSTAHQQAQLAGSCHVGVPRRTAHSRQQARRMQAGRAARVSTTAAMMRPSASTTAASKSRAFGQRLNARSPICANPGSTASIHAAAYRRGNRLVIAATVAGVEGLQTTDVRDLLSQPIKADTAVARGQLENGFNYVILSNKLPPKRFEAHLEVHAGSVDELPHEQGVAHFVEHVTFLGSKKRENLLGTGARANAYTDFHHTVFHVHAPVVNSITGAQMLPQVFDALREIAFEPEFLPSRIEKERKAIMAEAQMMNTIEYRVDCQLLQYLHHENNLGCRFPIGKMDQVQSWPHDVLRSFWQRWYFPANATLYVVGDLERDVEETKKLIERCFGSLPPSTMTRDQAERMERAALEAGPRHRAPAYVPLPPHLAAAATAGRRGSRSGSSAAAAGKDLLMKVRHAVRPPVVHQHGFGPLSPEEATSGPAEVSTFRHPLLQHFMLSVFCKLPIQPMTRMGQLRQMLMMRIILSVFQFRINSRYVGGDGQPPFTSIELDISDSGREGCAVSTLTVTSEPAKWREAVGVAVQEMRRLQRHGLTRGEVDRYRQAILRDSAQLAEQGNKIPSVDTLNFVMESLACGHTVMGHKEAHEAMVEVADSVTLDDVNALARSMLTFASDYGHEAEVLARAASEPAGTWAAPGPTRTTSIITCIPAYIDASGASISGGKETGGRGAANLGAAGHLDADTIDLAALEAQSKQEEEVEIPEGALRFDVSPSDIASALSDTSYDVTAPADVEVPEHLIAPEDVDALVAERRPHFVPLAGEGQPGPSAPAPEPFSGITQRRLSNGMRVNYRHTDNDVRGGLLRIIVNGGRASEKRGAGPDGFGAIAVGTRTLSENGSIGPWAREQVEVYCITNLVNCALDADEENIVFDVHFSVTDGGMQKAFELVHLFLEQPQWDEAAAERAKAAFLSGTRATGKSLERCTAERIMSAMLGGSDRQFREPLPEEIEALTLEGMQAAVSGLLHPGNMEVNVVGDFDPTELEHCLLRYLGTVAPRQQVAALLAPPVIFRNPPPAERHSAWHLKDSDERAAAYVAGAAPARWGPFGSFEPLEPIKGEVQPPVVVIPATASPAEVARITALRRNHPLFSGVVLMLLAEIINSRLFTTVRDSLGLTYDVSFEVTFFDRVRTAWFSVHVTSHPDKIYEALNASVAVLRDIAYSRINRRELARARTTLITRHESDLKDNTYWLGLLTHLQNPHVPLKTVQCLRDLRSMYEAVTVEDIYTAYDQLKLDDANIFTCVGTSGKVAPPVPELILNAPSSEFLAAAAGPMSHDIDMDGEEEYFDDEDQEYGEGEEQEGLPAASPSASASAGQQQQALNPMALISAMMAAAQAMNMKQAADKQQQQRQQ